MNWIFMPRFTDADLDRYLSEDPGGPVVMLNLLAFRSEGGQERYQEYVDAVQALSDDETGKPIYLGIGTPALEDDQGRSWDAVVLVGYPSRQSFVDLIRSPAYQKVAHLRDEALEDAVLQPTSSMLG